MMRFRIALLLHVIRAAARRTNERQFRTGQRGNFHAIRGFTFQATNLGRLCLARFPETAPTAGCLFNTAVTNSTEITPPPSIVSFLSQSSAFLGRPAARSFHGAHHVLPRNGSRRIEVLLGNE